MNSYFYELAAIDRIRLWHHEAETARRVRLVRRSRRKLSAPNPVMPLSVAPKPRTKESAMPLYMDVHNKLPDGATAADVAGAHEADVAIQARYGVTYRSYWVDQAAGKAFCLVEAPNKEAATTVHREAHGLLADELYEVVAG